MRKTYDTAVIGLGAMGSATLYNLAKRGARVIGFDQFEPGHDKGSSHGESRIIRLSYYEDLSYVPLLHRAYEEWRAFETIDGHDAGSVLTITGILEAGHPGSQAVANSLKAARHHGLRHTEMDAAEIGKRFPAFRLPSDWHGQFQPDGGFLRPEVAIRRFVSAAEKRGVDVHVNTRVRKIEPKPDAILVHTDDETIEAGSLVIAAGAWIGDFAPFSPASSRNHAPGRWLVSHPRARHFHAGPLPGLYSRSGGRPLLWLSEFLRFGGQGGITLARGDGPPSRRSRYDGRCGG